MADCSGPSIIIAYATCVDWGHRAGDKAMVQQQAEILSAVVKSLSTLEGSVSLCMETSEDVVVGV